MPDGEDGKKDGAGTAFEKAASAPQRSLAKDFWGYLRENKKWWLVPILLTFLLIAALLVFAGTAAAPFIYTLF
jgi:hypothetical protein